MDTSQRGIAQLHALDRFHTLFSEQGIDYWLFGGWAVDLHARRVTREHEDIDLAVWEVDLPQVRTLLVADGWAHRPDPGEDGYTSYECGDVRVDIAVLASDAAGVVYTPVAGGRGLWPTGSFGEDVAELDGVRARLVSLASLLEDKSGPRDDPVAARKDREDVAVLSSRTRSGRC